MLRRGNEHNSIAHSFQPLDQIMFQTFGIESIEVVSTEVLLVRIIHERAAQCQFATVLAA